MKKEKRLLGRLELQVMQCVWEHGEVTVRQVHRQVSKKKDLAYTTIMTVMKKLEQKGLLAHREQDRAFIYRPLIPRQEVEGSMLKELLQNVFGGDYRQLVNALVTHEKLSREKLIEIVEKRP